MKVTLQQIAKWIRDEHPGATTRDIQKKFNLAPKEAGSALQAIRVMKRYVTRYVPGDLRTRSPSSKPAQLYVDEINDPIYVKDPWGSVSGVRANPRGDSGDVVNFPSVYAADEAGFCAVAIYNCLRGESKTHGGYIWTAEHARDFHKKGE